MGVIDDVIINIFPLLGKDINFANHFYKHVIPPG